MIKKELTRIEKELEAAKTAWKATRDLIEKGTYVKLEKKDIDYYYVEHEGEVLVFFEKSLSFMDWLHDFFVLRHKYNGRKYHKGFFIVASRAYEDMIERIGVSGKKFFLYGHSLGGSTSSIIKDFMHDDGVEVSGHVTFGEPANAIGEDLREIRENSIRIEQGMDFFVRMFFLMYKHYGRKINLIGRGSYKKNHRYEWMEEC